MSKNLTNSSTTSSKTPEITVGTLQSLSFELITKSMELWRSFRETGHGKGRKLIYAVRIHAMVMDAVRLHPDIQQLAELHKMADQTEQQLEFMKYRKIVSRIPIEEQVRLKVKELEATPGAFDCGPPLEDLSKSSPPTGARQIKPKVNEHV